MDTFHLLNFLSNSSLWSRKSRKNKILQYEVKLNQKKETNRILLSRCYIKTTWEMFVYFHENKKNLSEKIS